MNSSSLAGLATQSAIFLIYQLIVHYSLSYQINQFLHNKSINSLLFSGLSTEFSLGQCSPCLHQSWFLLMHLGPIRTFQPPLLTHHLHSPQVCLIAPAVTQWLDFPSLILILASDLALALALAQALALHLHVTHMAFCLPMLSPLWGVQQRCWQPFEYPAGVTRCNRSWLPLHVIVHWPA